MIRIRSNLIHRLYTCACAVVLIGLAGCAGPDHPAIQEPAAQTPLADQAVQVEIDTPALPPVQPTQTPLPTATPSPVPIPTGPPVLSPISKEDLGKESTFHNAILFTSRHGTPFLGSTLGIQYNYSVPVDSLWLLNLETLSAAPITTPGLSSAVGLGHAERPRVVLYDGNIPANVLDALAPPTGCLPPQGWTGDPEAFSPCMKFYFSPDGRYLSYEKMIHGCSSQMVLLDLDTNQPVLTVEQGGHFLRPLANGRWLYATGSCGGGTIAVYDPLTGKKTALGPEPVELSWNPQRSAFYAHVFDEGGNEVALWGYNVEAGQVFFSMSTENEQYYSMPTWAPDGQSLVFQYNKGIRSEDGKKVGFYNPRHLIRVDINTRGQSKIADPAGDLAIVPGWLGDTLMIRRYPFQVQTFDYNVLHFSDELPPVVKCVTRGAECSLSNDLLAYDNRTGKLSPWSESGLPAATATPGNHPPALNQADPLYEDPGGAFQILLGPPMPLMPDNFAWQGYASLWFVPSGGKPLLWVESGRGFVYLP